MKSLLEIFIITYNRADDLSQTLSMLAGDIASRVSKITILNNCSTDNTIKIFEQWKAFIPNLFIVTHSCNIGGDANNLRAIELSQSTYTWILCDDDEIFASEMEDVWSAIKKEFYTLISLGVKDCKRPSNIGEFLLYHTYTPAGIFKTDFFKSRLQVCYNNIHTMFPQFPAMLSCYESGCFVYTSLKNPLKKGLTNIGYSPFKFWAGWKECCKLIKNPKHRKQAHKMLTLKSLIYSFIIENKNYRIINLIYHYYLSKKGREKIIFDGNR